MYYKNDSKIDTSRKNYKKDNKSFDDSQSLSSSTHNNVKDEIVSEVTDMEIQVPKKS